ncbi:hypothetical protein [Nocardia brevicatena]|uniref:hypothetical protein n=1 Tax=Nocardia brevicatena TaxID=37327 RepID=UPI0002EE0EE6|nr:hypothetical protein [Nocardia brevicatena]
MGDYTGVYGFYSHFGPVSATHHRSEAGEDIVVVRVGTNVSFHLPYDQAVALRVDLGEALARFPRTAPAITGRAA